MCIRGRVCFAQLRLYVYMWTGSDVTYMYRSKSSLICVFALSTGMLKSGRRCVNVFTGTTATLMSHTAIRCVFVLGNCYAEVSSSKMLC